MPSNSVASRVRGVCLGFALLGLIGGAAPAQVVTEFSTGITPNAAPFWITAGPDGNLWFTEPGRNRVARITPLGVVTEFPVISLNSQLRGIAAGPDGNVWFTEFNADRIGQATPLGAITEFSTGITANASPYGIVAGPDGNLWFTEQAEDKIGRITPLGVVTEFSTGISPNAQPFAITAGPDGNLWFTGIDRIGRITTAGAVTEFTTGISSNAQIRSITAGPDGNLWFTEYAGNRIGRITTAGVVTEFSAGITAGSGPFGIASGSDGNLWFTEQNGSRIGRITPAGVVTEFSAGISPGAIPQQITAGPDGNLWFTEAAIDRIGRITTGVTGPPPTVLSVAPDSGHATGGTAITLTGTGFVSGATVSVGGVVATGVNVTGGTTADATTPALQPGTLNDVTLVNPDTASGTLLDAWFADFTDIPQADIFHGDVEKLVRNSVTGGCGGGNYCRNNPVTRAQMAVFLLKSNLGAGYTPPACTGTVFSDVPCTGGAFDPWIEDLAGRSITGGCGGGAYCPGNAVTRAQMAVFLLKTELGSAYVPPACTGTVFADVPCTGGIFDPWIEDLAARNITGGCGSGNYCPGSVVTRGQMAVFLVKTFSLP